MLRRRSLNSRLSLISLALCFLASESPVSGSISNVDESVNMPFGFPTKGEGGPMSLRPPQVPLAVETYPVAPEPLKLQQVHVYVRHGERTPVGIRLNGSPANVPEYWNMCHAANRFKSTVCDMVSSEPNPAEPLETPLYSRRIVERKDGRAFDGECLLGELTDLGRQSTFSFGTNLRRLYIDRLGLLPDVLNNEGSVYFRTTNMPRTTESLQEIIRALYPQDKCHPSAIPAIRVRNHKDENLIGNIYACKRLEALQIGFAKAAADAFNPTLEGLDAKLSKYINDNPVRIDGRPRASGILDTVRSAVAHGVKVPSEFEDKTVIDPLERAVVNEWFADKTEEVRRLGMGKLLEDMMNKMEHRIANKDKDPLRLLVHSTHDTAIAAICSTFDVFDEKWPPFTASVTFEIFKDASGDEPAGSGHSQALLSRIGASKSKHYVRMRYLNKDMRLPVCADEGKHLPGHPEFCTLEAFKERVDQLIPKDWDAECNPVRQ
ncbi:histidine phosphatase superfamily [Coprinopsis sp. MPI-PUGE-AT-0042]|nr:histidine phosphatase superfamily [Coprinopsis sp. MPI-PUGE-AT-0042]